MVSGAALHRVFRGLETVGVAHLHTALVCTDRLQFPRAWRRRPVSEWTMESDDVLLRYIFRHFRPNRHLEFGTWEGDGVLRCLEECDATVWTVNLLEGETKDDGAWAYGSEERLVGAVSGRRERLVTSATTWVRTDAYGQIGHKYLARNLGHRVCQIYCDSRTWDTTHYPPGFFDTAFIDGGHVADVVHSDSWKAIALVRAGGLVMWHDFAPRSDARDSSVTAAQVTNQLLVDWSSISECFDRLFWIEPSWLLVGVRNAGAGVEAASLTVR